MTLRTQPNLNKIRNLGRVPFGYEEPEKLLKLGKFGKVQISPKVPEKLYICPDND